MRNRMIFYSLMGTLCLLFAACGGKTERQEEARIISVTLEPLRYFTEALAGERFRVVSLVPKGSSPETYDPTPRQLVDLGKSEAYIRIGYIGFEQVWMERLEANAPNMRVFDASQGIDVIRQSESHIGHQHEGGVEPHLWNSTVNARQIASNVCKALCELDSMHAGEYRQRLDSLDRVIQSTDSVIRSLLTEGDEAFLIYHPALSYFARDYGLIQIPIEQDGKEPSAAYLKKLVDMCRCQSIKVIFVQPEFDEHIAEIIASQTHTQVRPINPLAYNWPEEMIAVARALHKQEKP